MNSELISGRSVFRSNVVAVCAGWEISLFHTKVVPVLKPVAFKVGKIVDGQIALLLAV
jgi:hypothetical protein